MIANPTLLLWHLAVMQGACPASVCPVCKTGELIMRDGRAISVRQVSCDIKERAKVKLLLRLGDIAGEKMQGLLHVYSCAT